MKLENWNINANKVRLWAETQNETDPSIQAIMLSLTLGDNASDDDGRSQYWTAIRSFGNGLEGFPSARKGQQSSLSEAQQLVLATVEQTVMSAFAGIPTESHELLLSVIVPHGRTGGVFADWNAFCEDITKKAHNYMMTSIKEDRWDGESVSKSGVPQITPTPTRADMEAEEEE